MIRLDKYLADAGFGTRSEVRQLIKKKLVTVDGVPATSADLKIDPDAQVIACRGQAVEKPQEHYYFMLNKPAGVVSATEDPREKTVLDLLPPMPRVALAPVGRLDKDTEGLLLITDDGALTHRLLSPKKHVDKVYLACIDLPVTQEDVRRFAEGLDIGDEKLTLPAVLSLPLDPGEIPSGVEAACAVHVTLQEGRFHQVKRMFEAVGKKVVFLKRLQMGPLSLDPALLPGQYRECKKEEVSLLLRKA